MIFARRDQCPLFRVERTLCEVIATSESDPSATLAAPSGSALDAGLAPINVSV